MYEEMVIDNCCNLRLCRHGAQGELEPGGGGGGSKEGGGGLSQHYR